MITPVHCFGNWWAKRDDLPSLSDSPSGSKVRQFSAMIEAAEKGTPIVVGCAADSAMQVYVADAARQYGVPGFVFIPRRKERSPSTKWAVENGAIVAELRPGYPTQYRKAARDKAKHIGGCVRWDAKGAIADAMRQVVNIPAQARRIVIPTGSGLTAAGVAAGIANAGTGVEIFCVAVSPLASVHKITEKATALTTKPLPKITLVRHPSGYGDGVFELLPDGTLLDSGYAAKAMRYIHTGDVLWIPGTRPEQAMPVCKKEKK